MIRLQILGDIRIPGIPRVVPKKAWALVAYLSRLPEHTASREKIADMLWSHQGSEQARHSLRNSLLQIRKRAPGILDDHIQNHQTHIRLSPLVQSDVNEFLASIGSGDVTELEFACSLIRGRFLDAFEISSEPFEEWVSAERIRFDDLYNDALTRLAAMYTQANRHGLAIQTARRAIELDNLSERAHQALIAAFQGAGYAAQAAGHFASMRKLFYKEFGVSPSMETQQLLRKATETPGPAARFFAPDLTNEITKLRSEISALTHQIETAEATARHWCEKYDMLFNLVQRAKAKAAEKRAARAAIAA